ncbi:hypothetical protein [Nonomuraea cavernae]|uniref:Uncharacterized protein n=1 Tax=Nonomuraea cavernae TaxID=2045107 RepID=A0A918DQE1_9ACTN|nr:hypothetical protein [Nonomuraea cavernae]MCA2189922.1 hypothetical protein [Nonomuraea cavernae]GGO77892.1 hypothetical protein GCM10012289_58620 [Nonomuraea cavernae]
MTGFEINAGAVEQGAALVRAHGEDYGTAPDSLRARDGVSSWGDDGLFSGFTSIYAECRATSMAALSGLQAVIAATGDGLYQTARNTRETEAVNASATENLG